MIPRVTKQVSLRIRYVIYNAVLLVAIYFSGRLGSDWVSIVGVVAGIVVMNLVAWISSRHYKEWK